MLEAVHGLIIPDLIGEVGVRDGDLGRHVGDDVSIMDDPVAFSNAGGDVSGEILVTHSWFSEGVELVDVSEKGVDIQGGNGSQSRAQTVASDEDLGITIKRGQLLNFRTDVSLHTSECIIKALMHLTSSASWIGHLHEWKVT